MYSTWGRMCILLMARRWTVVVFNTSSNFLETPPNEQWNLAPLPLNVDGLVTHNQSFTTNVSIYDFPV